MVSLALPNHDLRVCPVRKTPRHLPPRKGTEHRPSAQGLYLLDQVLLTCHPHPAVSRRVQDQRGMCQEGQLGVGFRLVEAAGNFDLYSQGEV